MFFRASKFFLHASVFFVAIVVTSALFPFIVGKYAWFRTAVDLALITFLLGLLFDGNRDTYIRQLRDAFRIPLVIGITVFTIVFLLACVFAVDPYMAFWSNFERGEGGFQILHLYVFFLLLITLFREARDWKKFFWLMLLAAFLMILYGVAAGLKYIDAEFVDWIDGAGVQHRDLSGKGGPWFQTFAGFVGPQFSNPSFRFQGSIGNPAYVAIYLTFSLFYAFMLFLSRKVILRPLRTTVLVIAVLAFGTVFIFTETRGAFLGLMAGMAVLVLCAGFLRKGLRKWVAGVAVFGVILMGTLVLFRNSAIVEQFPASRLLRISIHEETFRHRVIMWGVAFEGWKDHPLLGYGPEGYLRVFEKHFNPAYFDPGKGFGAWFDRAHSVIFDYLVETGALGLLSYLSMFVLLYVTFFRFVRRKVRESEEISGRAAVAYALLCAIPVAYLVQGLVLFDVLVTYFNIFVLFAFAVFMFGDKKSFSESW